MPICFVIQPFDSGKFDKRFDDVFAPATKAAGLDPYRVDRDPGVDVPIEAIEDGIRNASVCLADITTDNPNVWYELGFAYATGRPVVMVCSNERMSGKYPFDIQHRTVLTYKPESLSDFSDLANAIRERIKALLNKTAALRQIAESDQVAPSHGLTQSELMVLAIIAGETALPRSVSVVHSIKDESERSGLTAIGFSLALRRLVAKKFIEIAEDWDENRDQTYSTTHVTDAGWEWIESNEALFVLKRTPPTPTTFADLENEIPF